MKSETLLAVTAIGAGILLRMTDVEFPDITRIEAQLVLGQSAAWSPLITGIVIGVQSLLGFSIGTVRGISILIGIACLPVIYGITRTSYDRKTSLTAVAIAALLPSHILISRLAYPDIHLCFAWLLTLFAFLRVLREERKEYRILWLILLYGAATAAGLMKLEGILLPLFLIAGQMVRKRSAILRDDIAWTLLAGMLPAFFSISAHYGSPGISPLTAFLSGLEHKSFLVHFVLLSIPLALLLRTLPKRVQSGALFLLLLSSLATLGPHAFAIKPYELYAQAPYWNTHADEINAILEGQERVAVWGYAGHEYRWYVRPEVLIAKDMQKPYPTDYVLVIGNPQIARQMGNVVYEDDTLAIVLQRKKE